VDVVISRRKLKTERERLVGMATLSGEAREKHPPMRLMYRSDEVASGKPIPDDPRVSTHQELPVSPLAGIRGT
jgi:hypothetical protein